MDSLSTGKGVERFVITWQNSDSAAGVSRRLRISPRRASRAARSLRQEGVNLKYAGATPAFEVG
jgi:hypothetical protein